MDQNFQTSFIPKKPIIEERVTSSQSISIFLILAILVLFIVLLGTGGLYFYNLHIQSNIADAKKSLSLAQDSFEQSKISELQLLDKRLNAATEVLDGHVTTVPIFTELQKITMNSVNFTKFGYELGTAQSPNIDVKMSGIAAGYRSLALQSDLFGNDPNFIDPVFSNFTLDTSGNVLFDVDFSVKPTFVNYKQALQAVSQG